MCRVFAARKHCLQEYHVTIRDIGNDIGIGFNFKNENALAKPYWVRQVIKNATLRDGYRTFYQTESAAKWIRTQQQVFLCAPPDFLGYHG